MDYDLFSIDRYICGITKFNVLSDYIKYYGRNDDDDRGMFYGHRLNYMTCLYDLN